MDHAPILIAGRWQAANANGSFHAFDPSTAAPLPAEFPVSEWSDCDAALTAAASAAATDTPPSLLAAFLNRYAELIESRAAEIVQTANQETALPKSPRLADIELPRTTHQLRLAAAAALDGAWAMPTIDAKVNICSRLAPIGSVLIFGPNNFPLAFNAISGGDFAAAIAAGNPVIAKSHPCHPATTRLLAEQAAAAAAQVGLHPGFVQMLYHISPGDCRRMMADDRLAAVAFTGSSAAGRQLKSAADEHGKPIYLEMSSINPVIILPGAVRERAAKIADEFTDSALAAAGQFCTCPGLLVLIDTPESTQFIGEIKQRFESRPLGPLLSSGVFQSLQSSVEQTVRFGAELVTGGHPAAGPAWRFQNTLLRVSAERFIAEARLQIENFGPVSLVVLSRDTAQAAQAVSQLHGNLTGCIYSDTTGTDDSAYAIVAPVLRRRVGRLLNDKMPTGVAVSPAMNHGGPYPATGHPGFTAVGIPAALRRFARLECYDNVRAQRLPESLKT